MTRREDFFCALRRQPAPQLIWAPNFDHWFDVNTANGTLPAEYRGMGRNDVVRAVGGTIWRRVTVVRGRCDASVKVDVKTDADSSVARIVTPVGEMRTVHRRAPDSSHAWFLSEHRVKGVEDMRTLRYVIEATRYELDPSEYEQQRALVGDDGILLAPMPCVPFIEFAKVDVGYANAYYLLADHPGEAQAVLDAYEKSFLEAFRLAAQSPCELMTTGDNMDQLTCPPDYFHRYAVPYYQQIAAILHATGKIAQGHWCGHLDQLVPHVPGCGLDVIEAVTPAPMSGVNMREAMDVLEGRIAVQGGIPSIYMCEAGCGRSQLADYIATLLEQVGNCLGFILGMGDNVPTDADFPRVKMVSDIVDEFNRSRRRSPAVAVPR